MARPYGRRSDGDDCEGAQKALESNELQGEFAVLRYGVAQEELPCRNELG
jgi:hypothetical protein